MLASTSLALVLITSLAVAEFVIVRRLSAEAGCDQHLAKPVNRRILLETVQSHCRDGVLV